MREEGRKDVDDKGIVGVGGGMEGGDMMIGKICGKGERDGCGEEKLVGGMLGDKGGDVKDC